MLERRLALSLAAARLFFSGAAIIFDTWFSNDPDVERFLCRYTLICANDLALDSATIELWNPDSNRLTTLASFRESLRRNPHSAARWCDLGDAYLHVGEPQRATYCYQQAVDRAPRAPPVLLRAGNFYYAAENTGRSLKHFARVLELSRAYDTAVFSQYQRMGASVTEVLASGLPAGMPQTAGAARAYLLHLLHEESVPGAVEVWDWMETYALVDQKALAPFLRLLLEKGEYDLAKKTQLRFASSAGRASPAGELVFNSGFEAAFLGTPLDWSIRRSKAARVRRDSEVFFQGSWALQMQFDGSINLSYDHVAQTIVTRAGPPLP